MCSKPPVNAARPLAYCPFTGKFFRYYKTKGWCETFLTKNSDGYLYGKVDGNTLGGHQQAMIMMGVDITGKTVDHINRIRNDNRFVNLRVLSHQANCCNTEGINVQQLPSGNWRARVGNKHLGVFPSYALARGTALWFKECKIRYDKDEPDFF